MSERPRSQPTLVSAAPVYGSAVRLDDPAETYHEASRLSPSVVATQVPGLRLLLDGDPVLHASVERAGRRHRHRPGVELGRPRLPRARLRRILCARRSLLPDRREPLPLHRLSSLLACAYGLRRDSGGRRRHVPSGGALYPLEVYVLGLDVGGAVPGLYHYDPYAHRLEQLDPRACETELAEVLIDPAAARRAAAVVLVTAVFWRTRFKYGQRGYRFALLEAGHVAQTLLLAGAALGVPALPVGGFYDRRAEAMLGVDGVDESVVYVVLLGGASR